MRRTSRRVVRNTVAYLMIIFFLLALVAEFSSGQTRRARSADPLPRLASGDAGARNPLVKLGQFAPDFELPKLTFKTDDTGKPIGVISEKDTVRLSSFRSTKRVVTFEIGQFNALGLLRHHFWIRRSHITNYSPCLAF